MKVLILAAGRGTRISRYLSGNPKCTVNIGGGKELIQYTVETLLKKGVTQIAIALGYRADVIRSSLKAYPQVQYYYNPFFDVTNSIASAWFARDFLAGGEETMIMNGDVYLEDRLMDYILAYQKSPVMFADGTRKLEADYKFYYRNHILEKYGKELSEEETSGEYIGVGRFDGPFMQWFVKEMNRRIQVQDHAGWWENVVYGLVENHEQPVFVEEINGMFWAEVDYIEDYDRILKFRGIEKRIP
ncbi:MAG: phosphocholine cytidylyltransferase family protein [bacterium]|nr:phosphocholine cytidylyltransferase family protein [bacterium]